MLKAKTPSNIEDYEIDKLVELIDPTPGLPSPRVRLNLVKTVCTALGLDLSPDLALALASEPQSQMIVATAGGGKTTGAQVKVILEKLMRKQKNSKLKLSGSKVLCLVYNNHNVEPMKDKQRSLVSRLRIANSKELNIDDEINACTMHSFCDQWRKEYAIDIGYMNFTHLDEGAALVLLDKVITKVLKKYSMEHYTVSASSVYTLYDFWHESLLSIEELKDTDKFIDLGLPCNVVEDIFELYTTMKQKKRKYDYTDMLVSVYNLLSTNETVLKRVQRFYSYVVADEFQDFTPIMIKILELLVSDGTPLLCIGDEDQGIYGFRGADIYGTLNFANTFNGGEVYLLSRNRRCKKEILDLAKSVVGQNTLRFDKQILGVKEGGSVKYTPYLSTFGENTNVVSRLQAMEETEREETVVCYRERKSSLMLVEMLEEKQIPFHVIGGYRPFQYELYRHIFSVLDMLECPVSRHNLLHIYKVLPIKKQDVYTALTYNPSTFSFKNSDKIHFAQVDFGSAMNNKGFKPVIKQLTEISDNMSTAPLSSYFPIVYGLLDKYYWRLIKSKSGLGSTIEKYLEEKIFSLFNVNKTYAEVYEELTKRRELCERNQNMGYGLTVSTFHGLKGLEFNNSIIIDMDNDVFPNFSLIDSKPYPEKVINELKEAETRLYYVALTRARNSLEIYYFESNPSKYVIEQYLKPARTSEIENSLTVKDSSVISKDAFLFEDDLLEDDLQEEFLPSSVIGTSLEDTFLLEDDLLDDFSTSLESGGSLSSSRNDNSSAIDTESMKVNTESMKINPAHSVLESLDFRPSNNCTRKQNQIAALFNI